MRFRTLEIRWHDGKPISSCDFQPMAFKKVRHGPDNQDSYATQAYRLATAGEDNHVRIWLVHPNICPTSIVSAPNSSASSRPPRVEYLSTLSRHSAAVNVVRFSPNGELIASAGDDGMIIIWSQSITPHSHGFMDAGDSDLDREHWKPRATFRCTTMQVYDLAWSPTGEYIITGSTDNVARIFSASDGKCIFELAEHSHYVQGVAWDPLNEYIATQSSDRAMHIYQISEKNGAFEVHAVGKNSRMLQRHTRTHSTHRRSTSRPREAGFRKETSATSDVESVVSDLARDREEFPSVVSSSSSKDGAPLTPAASVLSTPSGVTSAMFPPPLERASSRRSSFSESNALGSPSTFSRYGRSPSPMPALPAIRTPPSPATWANVRLYGDESFSNFFRRLTFSPDGGLLLTPAGHFEDPSIILSPGKADDTSRSASLPGSSTSPATSCVYVYSRANFARPPVAQLPGHQKPSVAVRYSPILYELRPGLVGLDSTPNDNVAVLESGIEGVMDVDMVGSHSALVAGASMVSPQATPALKPVHSRSLSQSSSTTSPLDANVSSTTDTKRPASPVSPHPPASGSGHRSHTHSSSAFALPYRMIYAVLTMDSVAIYDTQQSTPLCLLAKLHYDEFTDVTWSPDGQCLILSSRDGYCTLIIFDDIIPAYHTQQQALQMQQIAHHHSVPVTVAHTVNPPSSQAGSANVISVNPKKRAEPPLTPAPSVDGDGETAPSAPPPADVDQILEPPKKKRRVALTHVGDLDAV